MPKPSPVRDHVHTLVLGGSRHLWSLDDLLDQVRSNLGAADYSTVFRAVARLEQQGLIQRVELGDGKSYYEPATAHHDHIRCTGCGTVAESGQDCVISEAEEQVSQATGFVISGHRLVFMGICPSCQAS